jgi:hypothetical protein
MSSRVVAPVGWNHQQNPVSLEDAGQGSKTGERVTEDGLLSVCAAEILAECALSSGERSVKQALERPRDAAHRVDNLFGPGEIFGYAFR